MKDYSFVSLTVRTIHIFMKSNIKSFLDTAYFGYQPYLLLRTDMGSQGGTLYYRG